MIFVATGAWFAAFVPNDPDHRAANQWLTSNQEPLLTSDYVIDVESAATSYGEILREHVAGAFEVLMLGVGPDGHVASLFPGHAQLDVDDRVSFSFTDSQSRRSGRLRSRPMFAASRAVLHFRTASSSGSPANFCAWK